MKKIYKLLIVVLLCNVGINAMAQTSYSYTYDDAGNREERKILVLKSAEIEDVDNDSTPSNDLESQIDENKFNDQIGEISLTLYPNPTQGHIEISAKNMGSDANCEILVFDTRGSILIKQAWTNGQTRVDLRDYPQGSYFVKFVANGKVTQWTVIKE